MNQEKLQKHDLKWLHPRDRESKFPGGEKPVQIGNPETRTPLLWIGAKSIANNLEGIYLINDSGEVLEEVNPKPGGFLTIDDEEGVPVESYQEIVYRNVQLGEAVKVEEYDIIYDSDYALNLTIQVKSKKLGHLVLTTLPEKGGIGEMVLLWDTIEEGKNVAKMERLEE